MRENHLLKRGKQDITVAQSLLSQGRKLNISPIADDDGLSFGFFTGTLLYIILNPIGNSYVNE